MSFTWHDMNLKCIAYGTCKPHVAAAIWPCGRVPTCICLFYVQYSSPVTIAIEVNSKRRRF